MNLFDSRPIYGNGGRVEWLADDSGHVVNVIQNDGEIIGSVSTDDLSNAAEFFLHPFARPEVPDIFKKTPEDITSYDDDERQEEFDYAA